MDLKSIEEAIDQYNNKISNDTNLNLSNGEKPIKMSPQEFFEFIEKHNLIHTDHVESAVEQIQKVYFSFYILGIIKLFVIKYCVYVLAY